MGKSATKAFSLYYWLKRGWQKKIKNQQLNFWAFGCVVWHRYQNSIQWKQICSLFVTHSHNWWEFYMEELVHGVFLLKNGIQHTCKQAVSETCYIKYKQLLSESSRRMDRTSHCIWEWQEKRDYAEGKHRTELQCVTMHGFSYSYQAPFPLILRLLVLPHWDNLYEIIFSLHASVGGLDTYFCCSCSPWRLVELY